MPASGPSPDVQSCLAPLPSLRSNHPPRAGQLQDHLATAAAQAVGIWQSHLSATVSGIPTLSDWGATEPPGRFPGLTSPSARPSASGSRSSIPPIFRSHFVYLFLFISGGATKSGAPQSLQSRAGPHGAGSGKGAVPGEPFALPEVQLSAPRAPLRGGGGPPSAPRRWGCKRRGGRRAPSTAGGGPCDPGGCLAPPPSASQACRGLCFSYNEIRSPPPDSGAGLGRNSRGLGMGSPSPRASRGDRAGREAPRGRRGWGPRGASGA